VVGLVTGTSGPATAQYEYDPFGQPTRRSGTLAALNPFRFSSKYEDEESGFLYYGYRFYNASTGRWLSRDPIEEAAFALNSSIETPASGAEYLFLENDPISSIDYLGLAGKYNVKNCQVVVLITHNTTINHIVTGKKCSSAAAVACAASSSVDVDSEVPGWAAHAPTGGLKGPDVAAAADTAWRLAVKHGHRLCKGGSNAPCQKITVRIDCKMGTSRIWMPAGYCGRKVEIPCCGYKPPLWTRLPFF
jgi:RHS repeat-associated protein